MLMSSGFRPIFVPALVFGALAMAMSGSLMAQDAQAQEELDFDDLFGDDEAAPAAPSQGTATQQSTSSSTTQQPAEQVQVVELPEEPVPETPKPPSDLPAHLEEIVVTARKRSESIQEVPLSVTPFNADVLEQRGMSGLDDIAASTPGFTFEAFQSGGAHGNAVIRGLAQQFTTSRIQNVSFFLDGVYLQRQSMLDLGMIDMQRVEVVKGPQNALYGRNAFAGAVNYITLRPGSEPEGYLSTTLGDNGREQYRISTSGPLDDSQTLFGKFTAGFSRYDGHTRNNHPVANANPPGDNLRGMVGGHDDQTYSVSLAWEPLEKLRTRASFFRSELLHETGAGYGISGVHTARFTFRREVQNDLNCNVQTVPLIGQDQNPAGTVTGNSLWCGELPLYASDIPDYEDGTPSRRVQGIVVDPRAVGFRARTNAITLSTDYDISDNLTAYYLYGQALHDSYTDGGTSDEDPVEGRRILIDFTGAAINAQDNQYYVFANTASGRPNSELESFSHELRFDWEPMSDLRISAGAYYSIVEDQEWTTIFVNDLCNADTPGNIENCNEPLLFPNTLAEQTRLTTAPGYDLYVRQHGGAARGEWSAFKDSISAAFMSASYDFTPTIEGTIEGRFTREEKEVTRFTDSQAIPAGESVGYGLGSDDPLAPVVPGLANPLNSLIVVPYDEESFNYFTPRGIVNWQWADRNMLYASAAKGVKSGGFNNADSPEELTYDAAENWTYELGSKNSFLGRTVTLNGAVYFIDWTGLQGGVPPAVEGASASDVITNIGDVSSLGVEFESTLFLPWGVSVDLGGTWNDAKYDDDVVWAAAQEGGKFQCDGTTCPADGSVGGNQLARTSKIQGSLGINYHTSVLDGWEVNARIDTNYQSKQYLTPLNLGWVPERMLTNASFNISSPNGQWEFNSWVKNLTDEDYPANSFVIGVFNQYLVGKGPGITWGSTLKYKF